MKKILCYLFLAFVFLLTACSNQSNVTTNSTEEQSSTETEGVHTTHWSYEEETGPERWGELDSSYATCVNGTEQSPVNIEVSQIKSDEKADNLKIQYQASVYSLINNGHTVQATPTQADNSITIDETVYKLAQFHFHTPSEHQFNGQNLAMELHFVHQNANSEIAVLGVMIKEGNENEVLASLWDALPMEESQDSISVKDSIDLQNILPEDQTAFYYNGSLTTPPCTEEVKWIVFENPIEMSSEQIEKFKQIFPDNHRPVQALNEREILGF